MFKRCAYSPVTMTSLKHGPKKYLRGIEATSKQKLVFWTACPAWTAVRTLEVHVGTKILALTLGRPLTGRGLNRHGKIDQHALKPQVGFHRLASQVLAYARLVITAGRNHKVIAAPIPVNPDRACLQLAHRTQRAADVRRMHTGGQAITLMLRER